MISSFVITGFLGVGKTTMLTNTVKNHFADKKIAIIVNEFGDVGVDSNILKNVHSEVLEISEGCICCKLSQEFESGVIEIINKYEPDIIFVETSGASEPFPIFLSLQNLGISVEGIICVVDAKNFTSYSQNSTANYQIGGANIIVLNKVDLVTPDELAMLKENIRDIKEKYNIRNNLTGKSIFSNYVMQESKNGIVNRELFDGVYKVDEIVSMAKEYQHSEHTQNDLITQRVVYVKREVSFSDIESFLKALPKNIYRAKGVIKTIDVEKTLFVNSSFGDASYEPLEEYDGASLLVLIGENIDSSVEGLIKEFEFIYIPMFRAKL